MTFDPSIVERPIDLTPPSTLSEFEEGKEGKNGRHYKEPTNDEISRVKTAMQEILEQKITSLGHLHQSGIERRTSIIQ